MKCVLLLLALVALGASAEEQQAEAAATASATMAVAGAQHEHLDAALDSVAMIRRSLSHRRSSSSHRRSSSSSSRRRSKKSSSRRRSKKSSSSSSSSSSRRRSSSSSSSSSRRHRRRSKKSSSSSSSSSRRRRRRRRRSSSSSSKKKKRRRRRRSSSSRASPSNEDDLVLAGLQGRPRVASSAHSAAAGARRDRHGMSRAQHLRRLRHRLHQLERLLTSGRTLSAAHRHRIKVYIDRIHAAIAQLGGKYEMIRRKRSPAECRITCDKACSWKMIYAKVRSSSRRTRKSSKKSSKKSSRKSRKSRKSSSRRSSKSSSSSRRGRTCVKPSICKKASSWRRSELTRLRRELNHLKVSRCRGRHQLRHTVHHVGKKAKAAVNHVKHSLLHRPYRVRRNGRWMWRVYNRRTKRWQYSHHYRRFSNFEQGDAQFDESDPTLDADPMVARKAIAAAAAQQQQDAADGKTTMQKRFLPLLATAGVVVGAIAHGRHRRKHCDSLQRNLKKQIKELSSCRTCAPKARHSKCPALNTVNSQLAKMRRDYAFLRKDKCKSHFRNKKKRGRFFEEQQQQQQQDSAPTTNADGETVARPQKRFLVMAIAGAIAASHVHRNRRCKGVQKTVMRRIQDKECCKHTKSSLHKNLAKIRKELARLRRTRCGRSGKYFFEQQQQQQQQQQQVAPKSSAEQAKQALLKRSLDVEQQESAFTAAESDASSNNEPHSFQKRWRRRRRRRRRRRFWGSVGRVFAAVATGGMSEVARAGVKAVKHHISKKKCDKMIKGVQARYNRASSCQRRGLYRSHHAHRRYYDETSHDVRSGETSRVEREEEPVDSDDSDDAVVDDDDNDADSDADEYAEGNDDADDDADMATSNGDVDEVDEDDFEKRSLDQLDADDRVYAAIVTNGLSEVGHRMVKREMRRAAADVEAQERAETVADANAESDDAQDAPKTMTKRWRRRRRRRRRSHCRNASQMGNHGHTCVHVCEHRTAHLSCPGGHKIKVHSASYGQHGNCHSVGRCHSHNSLSKVKSRCNGRHACAVPATNSFFGDPCRGTFKRMDIKFQCVSAAPKPVKHSSSTVTKVHRSHKVEHYKIPLYKKINKQFPKKVCTETASQRKKSVATLERQLRVLRSTACQTQAYISANRKNERGWMFAQTLTCRQRVQRVKQQIERYRLCGLKCYTVHHVRSLDRQIRKIKAKRHRCGGIYGMGGGRIGKKSASSGSSAVFSKKCPRTRTQTSAYLNKLRRKLSGMGKMCKGHVRYFYEQNKAATDEKADGEQSQSDASSSTSAKKTQPQKRFFGLVAGVVGAVKGVQAIKQRNRRKRACKALKRRLAKDIAGEECCMHTRSSLNKWVSRLQREYQAMSASNCRRRSYFYEQEDTNASLQSTKTSPTMQKRSLDVEQQENAFAAASSSSSSSSSSSNDEPHSFQKRWRRRRRRRRRFWGSVGRVFSAVATGGMSEVARAGVKAVKNHISKKKCRALLKKMRSRINGALHCKRVGQYRIGGKFKKRELSEENMVPHAEHEDTFAKRTLDVEEQEANAAAADAEQPANDEPQQFKKRWRRRRRHHTHHHYKLKYHHHKRYKNVVKTSKVHKHTHQDKRTILKDVRKTLASVKAYGDPCKKSFQSRRAMAVTIKSALQRLARHKAAGYKYMFEEDFVGARADSPSDAQSSSDAADAKTMSKRSLDVEEQEQAFAAGDAQSNAADAAADDQPKTFQKRWRRRRRRRASHHVKACRCPRFRYEQDSPDEAGSLQLMMHEGGFDGDLQYASKTSSMSKRSLDVEEQEDAFAQSSASASASASADAPHTFTKRWRRRRRRRHRVAHKHHVKNCHCHKTVRRIVRKKVVVHHKHVKTGGKSVHSAELFLKAQLARISACKHPCHALMKQLNALMLLRKRAVKNICKVPPKPRPAPCRWTRADTNAVTVKNFESCQTNCRQLCAYGVSVNEFAIKLKKVDTRAQRERKFSSIG